MYFGRLQVWSRPEIFKSAQRDSEHCVQGFKWDKGGMSQIGTRQVPLSGIGSFVTGGCSFKYSHPVYRGPPNTELSHPQQAAATEEAAASLILNEELFRGSRQNIPRRSAANPQDLKPLSKSLRPPHPRPFTSRASTASRNLRFSCKTKLRVVEGINLRL